MIKHRNLCRGADPTGDDHSADMADATVVCGGESQLSVTCLGSGGTAGIGRLGSSTGGGPGNAGVGNLGTSTGGGPCTAGVGKGKCGSVLTRNESFIPYFQQ